MSIEPKEVFQGVYRWTSLVGNQSVSSHLVTTEFDGCVLIDPAPPTGGKADVDSISQFGRPEVILLTSDRHEWGASDWKRRLGARVRCHPASAKGVRVRDIVAIEDDEMLPARLRAIHTPGAAEGEMAYYVPWGGGAFIIGETLVNTAETHGLNFLPDEYCSDPLELRRSVKKLYEWPFEALLLTRGEPLTKGARERIGRMLETAPSLVEVRAAARKRAAADRGEDPEEARERREAAKQAAAEKKKAEREAAAAAKKAEREAAAARKKAEREAAAAKKKAEREKERERKRKEAEKKKAAAEKKREAAARKKAALAKKKAAAAEKKRKLAEKKKAAAAKKKAAAEKKKAALAKKKAAAAKKKLAAKKKTASRGKKKVAARRPTRTARKKTAKKKTAKKKAAPKKGKKKTAKKKTAKKKTSRKTSKKKAAPKKGKKKAAKKKTKAKAKTKKGRRR